MQYLKVVIIYAVRFLLKVSYILPIKQNRILFISYDGKRYSCNPKYIFEYMYSTYGSRYEYIWCLRNRKNLPNEFFGIKVVNYFRFKFCLVFMTSKYIISNMVIQPIFPIRKCQIFVNTHHGGGAYKRSSWHIPAYKKRAFSMRVMNKIRNGMTAYLISSCREFNFAALDLWDLPGNKILPIGMPRNDIFFSDINPIKEKVTRYLNMNNNIKKIILYAPTFRGIHNDVEEFKYQLDIGSILLALKERFNDDFIFLYRSHHLFHNNVNNQELQGCVSVSEYQEMQELLCAADVLITDYSSCMWDFSFTHKPCFIYAPDLIKYTEVQGFYTPIEKWPFPVAETNERLVYNILHFDEEKYRNDVKQHHLDLGSFETGTASKQFCKILFGNGEI